MLYLPTLISVIEVLLVIIPVLLTVAYATVAERKTMASMQRRLGPNIVGYYGLLQAFADALKLLLKEYVSPTQANLMLFFLGPIITLVFSLLGYAVIPFGPGLAISDYNLGILYMLAVSSLATYGIFVIFFIGSVAETNRAPFDLAEAESELVSGFMTEHAAVIFVFFFLAEYASIVLICILTTILFLGGYLYDYIPDLYIYIIKYINVDLYYNYISNKEIWFSNPTLEGLTFSISLGIKSCIMIFVFIWVRASFPRIRFDQLMSFC